MNKLKDLLSRCKCGVFLSVNEQRDYYLTAEQQLDDWLGLECPPEITQETRDVIIATDTIVNLQFFPDTPIGSYQIVHHDLDIALDMALAFLGDKK